MYLTPESGRKCILFQSLEQDTFPYNQSMNKIPISLKDSLLVRRLNNEISHMLKYCSAQYPSHFKFYANF